VNGLTQVGGRKKKEKRRREWSRQSSLDWLGTFSEEMGPEESGPSGGGVVRTEKQPGHQ